VIVTSATPVLVPLPHEPGQSVSIRRLSWLELEAARRVAADAYFATLETMAPAVRDAIAAVALAGQTAKADQAESGPEPSASAPINPLTFCDKRTAMRAGICGWSYAADLTDANKDALDVETARIVWAALLELHDPLPSGAASTSR
jgi:hypothetical protein